MAEICILVQIIFPILLRCYFLFITSIHESSVWNIDIAPPSTSQIFQWCHLERHLNQNGTFNYFTIRHYQQHKLANGLYNITIALKITQTFVVLVLAGTKLGVSYTIFTKFNLERIPPKHLRESPRMTVISVLTFGKKGTN